MVLERAASVVLAALLVAALAAPAAFPQPQATVIDLSRVKLLADTLASFGSRMTGYPGYYSAANFIYGYLRVRGLEVRNHTYKVLVPVEVESYIEVLEPFKARVTAHALYPNGVNPHSTPLEGVEGELIYVGVGDMESFDGKRVEGSIVAMDFNSQDNWLNAAKLGAKAVVLIEPVETTYFECDKKFLDTPLGFLRLYVKRDDWELLRNATRVRVVSRVEWREVEATNFIAVVPGLSPRDVVIVAAHYDSWSVVPALASSRADAIAPALLLELARYLRENPPRYTVWLVFLSGHWQALAGAREFVEDYFFRGDVASGKVTVWGFIGLDKFASDSDGLQLLYASYYTTYGGTPVHSGGFPARLSWVMTAVHSILGERPVRELAQRELGVRDPRGLVSTFFSAHLNFWGTEPFPYMLDSEAASISGVPAFSIVSRSSGRLYVGTPLDDSMYADVTRLGPFLQLAAHIVVRLLNMEWQVPRDAITPTRYDLTTRRGYPGFTTFYGKVVTYNFTKGWYDPVPNAIVELQLVMSTYKLNKIIVRSDEEGKFVVHGIPHAGRGVYGATVIPFSRWVARGWVFNGSRIVMATDLGQFGMQNFPLLINVLHPHENVTVVVAKSVVVELFDVNFPTTLTTPSLPDPRTSYFDWWRHALSTLQPYELFSKSLPLTFGFYYNGWEPVALVWTQPGIRFIVVGYVGMGERVAATPFLLLTNSTLDNTEGFGFTGSAGDAIRVYRTAYAVARDFYLVSRGRYRLFTERHVGSPSANATLLKASKYLSKAVEAFEARAYSAAYAYSLIARAHAYKAYTSEVMPLVNDAARSMLFMFPLVAFASFFLEKILLKGEGVRRVIYMTAMAGVLLWFFSLIHPAFTVISNLLLGLIGSLILIILIITLIMVGSEGEALRSAIERRVLGVHRAETSKLDTAITAFSMGSEYIRRRPLRTALMLVTLIAMTAAITSFTSLMPARVTLPVLRYAYQASLDGVLLKDGRGVPPQTLSADLVSAVRVIVGPGYYVLPRAWVYPPINRMLQQVAFSVVSESGRNATVAALVGVTAEEYRILYSKFASGAGIMRDEWRYAVISKGLAQNLSVTVGDRIYVMGQEFVVSGIIVAPEAFDKVVEADGYSPMPADPIFFTTLAKDVAVAFQAGALPPNLGTARVIIIPYREALRLNGYVASVAIIPKQGATREQIFETVRELAYALDITAWFASGGTPYVASTFTSLAVGGWEMVVTLIVIGALNVTAIVLGNLKERTREIYVLSAVGLSPAGIAVFFLTEVLVYATVGIVLGYLAGYALTRLMTVVGVLPAEHVFNFASAFTIVGSLTILGAALAAVAYPSRLASRLITPSLERKWKPPTRPKKNYWEIPLPMSAPSEAEAKGVLAYLYEYYSGAGAVREGVHVTREIVAPDYATKTLTMVIALVPLEAGVQQKVDISVVRAMNRYIFIAALRRLSGADRFWIDGNYKFIDDLRKQMLMWSSLPLQERAKYIKAASA